MSQAFYDDAAKAHEEYDALARDIVKTLPEEEWPTWVKNRVWYWKHGPIKPVVLPNPADPMDTAGDTHFPKEWLDKSDANLDYGQPENYFQPEAKWKFAAGEATPADYTPDDPYDIQGKMPLINAMQVHWWDMPPEQAKQIIANAFRATMVSPKMELKHNAILYQSLMHIPADESDPEVFESAIRDLKARWDKQGQGDLFSGFEDTLSPEEQLPGKYMPGFWGNIRRLAGLGPNINQIYEAAMQDIESGGTGEIFRQKVLDLGIPGVGPKVASFAWLALAPTTSELATLDIHMMRHLNQPGDSPKNTNQYLDLENQLRNERDEEYGSEVPLGQYQWAVWDARRTPGYHQDHTALRAYQPTPFTDVNWAPTVRPQRTKAPMTIPNQQQLFGKWNRLPAWKLIRLSAGYTIQGKIIKDATATAQGIAVRPDTQSKDEVMGIINNLSTHQEDITHQRKITPEWAINRGGKVAVSPPPTAQNPFGLGPGSGFTYAPGVICVSEWIDVDDAWLLLNPACIGIVAQKGGASSHGAIVALERNIAVIVDASGAAQIRPGDYLQMNSKTGIIYVNGGSTEQMGEAQEADLPVIRFIWSLGHGKTAPVPQDDPEGGVLHRQMMMEQYREGHWDREDNALGVVYADGRVQMTGQPSDEEQMLAWLNQIHPVTQIEKNFEL